MEYEKLRLIDSLEKKRYNLTYLNIITTIKDFLIERNYAIDIEEGLNTIIYGITANVIKNGENSVYYEAEIKKDFPMWYVTSPFVTLNRNLFKNNSRGNKENTVNENQNPVNKVSANDTERELLKQLRENSRADIGIADKIRNEGKILEKLINNQAQNDSQSTKPSTKEELEKDELYQRIKKERGQVKVINSNEFSWEQIIKDTLAFPNAMRDFCYPSEKSPFGKSGEIFTNTDIKKNEYYTPPQPKENRKSTHGRYLKPAHEEEIERVVSSIFDSVAREMGY
jgi:hypothetical protein